MYHSSRTNGPILIPSALMIFQIVFFSLIIVRSWRMEYMPSGYGRTQSISLIPGSLSMVLDDTFSLTRKPEHWQFAYVAARLRGYTIPESPPPVWVAVERWGELVASVGAIETDAGVVMYEWLVTNPYQPLRVRYSGLRWLFHAGQVYATATGKRILMISRPSIAKAAERFGFARREDGVLMIGDK